MEVIYSHVKLDYHDIPKILLFIINQYGNITTESDKLDPFKIIKYLT